MMNVAHTLASPVSPYQHHNTQQQARPAYFSDRSLVASPASHQAQAPTGLGLYPLSIPQAQQSSIRTASPHPASSWSQSSAEQQSYSAPTTSAQQDLYSMSTSFDTYPSFPAQQQQQQQQQQRQQQQQPTNLSSPEAPALEYCQSAASSELPSHRNSVCSYTSEAAEMNMTARVEPDGSNGGWYSTPSNEHVLQRDQMGFPHGGIMPHQSTEELYRSSPQTADWTPSEKYAPEMQAAPNSRLPTFDMHPVLPSVARQKAKRKRTTPEEATHECRICHKLFKRSYNWKSHMETHNPERRYPHPCTAMVGNAQCSKKFQRKTDLDRHYDSVHLKTRNHKCHLCGNKFARRDTLRRHTEDGCPKRFELGIRDAAAAQMQPQQQQQQQQQQHQHQAQRPLPQLHQTQAQQQAPSASRWPFPAPSSMGPGMMHMPAPAFQAYAMPPPAAPYQA